jgi:hypothetical protein
MTTRVAAFVPDLMDRSRISAAAPDTTFVATAAALAGVVAEVVVVDLARPGAIEAVAGAVGRTIGFASHVDRDTIEAARAAGCDEVLARSEFFRRVAELLAPS